MNSMRYFPSIVQQPQKLYPSHRLPMISVKSSMSFSTLPFKQFELFAISIHFCINTQVFRNSSTLDIEHISENIKEGQL